MRYALTENLSELLGVDIKERGVNALLLCPFHDENTPSFSIHLEEGVWHCFGCGKKGGLSRLYRELGERMSDDIYHDRLIKSLSAREKVPSNFYSLARQLYSSISRQAAQEPLLNFINSRAISRDAVYKFRVGYSESRSAIAFPYWDHENSSVSGIKYRTIGGSKVAEPGSEFGLYNVDDARGRGVIIICEGESDTMSVWSNLPSRDKVGVVGLSGAVHDNRTWERWAIDMIFAKRVYIALDADETGDKGAAAAISTLGEDKCVRMRPTLGKDMSEHIINGGSLADAGLEDVHLELR